MGRELKFQNTVAFEKHLAQGAKYPLARVFLIISSCPYERKKIVEKVVAAIASKEGAIHFQVEDGTRGSVQDSITELNTTSLFKGKQVLYLDGIDKIKKSALVPLCDFVAKPSPFSYLVLGANSGKGLTELYAKGKKELIACDLSEEKPWDRKERLKRMLIEDVAKEGRRLSGDAVEYLLENVGLNLSSLQNEVDKLITYAGERSELTLQDVHALCAAEKTLTLWQLVDAIAWKEPFPKLDENIDLSLLLPLLSQLRTQFQLGLEIAVLLERGTHPSEIAHFLPHVKSAALTKALPLARTRRSGFFKRSLDLLFDIELMAKNSGFDPALILDCLITKLTLLKQYYAVPVSKSFG